MSNKKTLTFKNTLYNIIDNGEIGNGWKYVEVLNKKSEFSLPQCLYYKGDTMKKLLTYTEYINHLDVSKDFMNDFVKDIFRECYPGSKNPICKVKESLMIGGAGTEADEKPAEEAAPAEAAPAAEEKPAEEAAPAEAAPAAEEKPAEEAAPAAEEKPADGDVSIYAQNPELSAFMGDDKYLVASKKTEEMSENYLYFDYSLLTESNNPFVLFISGGLVKEMELYLKIKDDFFKVEYGEKRTIDIDAISKSSEKINRLAKLIVRDVVKTKEEVDNLGEEFNVLKELVNTFEKDEKNKNKTLFRKGYRDIPPAPSTIQQTQSDDGEEENGGEEEKGGEIVVEV